MPYELLQCKCHRGIGDDRRQGEEEVAVEAFDRLSVQTISNTAILGFCAGGRRLALEAFGLGAIGFTDGDMLEEVPVHASITVKDMS